MGHEPLGKMMKRQEGELVPEQYERIKGDPAEHSTYDVECLVNEIERLKKEFADSPVPMILWCPACGERHIDKGEFATKSHHTHACQICGHVWRPAVICTVGVQFLPGFKDKEEV